MRFFIDDFLRRAFVQVCVRLELEKQIETVDQEKHHTGATTDSQNCGLSLSSLFFLERGVEGSLCRTVS